MLSGHVDSWLGVMDFLDERGVDGSNYLYSRKGSREEKIKIAASSVKVARRPCIFSRRGSSHGR